jgi:hypothetical protein
MPEVSLDPDAVLTDDPQGKAPAGVVCSLYAVMQDPAP